VVGDLRQGGEEYARRLLSRIKPARPKNQVVLELFTPAPESYFQMVAEAFPNFNFETSPESHDEKVRRATGKFYSNGGMEKSIRYALDHGCSKFDVFFMIGLRADSGIGPGTLDCDTCEDLRPAPGPHLSLAPFLDPGCIAFEASGWDAGFLQNPGGYRKALLAPS
jgi:hypothetical protein